MATIKKRNNSFAVNIRKKETSIYATFQSEEDAILWAKYKEDLIDQVEAFSVPVDQLVTIEDALEMKYAEKMKTDRKLHNQVIKLKKDFIEWLDLPIDQITLEMIKFKASEMENKGLSLTSIRNQTALFSSAISFQIERGANIQNQFTLMLSQIRGMKKCNKP